MFALDTHVHLLVSKSAAPDWDEIGFATDAAAADGLAAMCITEHLDALHYPALVDGIFNTRRLGGRLLSPGVLALDNGLILSCGAEIALNGGGDVGVHAEPDVLLALDRRKGAYRLGELIETLRNWPSTVAIVAHHVHWPGKSIADLAALRGSIDALELPAKDLAHAKLYISLGVQLELPMVGGSDAHTWVQIGSARSVADAPPGEDFSPACLRRMLKAGAIRPWVLGCASERVRISGLLRARLEARGGH